MAQTTEAQGEKVLAGGDGPHGEYVIKLFEGSAAIAARPIAIPSMRIEYFSPNLFHADIRTSYSAVAAVAHIDTDNADATKARDMIGEQRSLVRQLIVLEINQVR